MGKIKDMAGMRFGRLTVVRYAGVKKGLAQWLCHCDCGGEITLPGTSLRNGNTRSCGCIHKELNHQRWYRHGESRERLHRVWIGMMQRCYYTKHKAYSRYGGRDISVCDEWFKYANFKEWALLNGYDENAPFGECTLDRINNDGNYEPSNCRWVTFSEQAVNKRSCRFVTYMGNTMTVSQWAKATGIKYHTLLYRLRAGWDLDRVFTKEPLQVV